MRHFIVGMVMLVCGVGVLVSLSGCEHSGTAANDRTSSATTTPSKPTKPDAKTDDAVSTDNAKSTTEEIASTDSTAVTQATESPADVSKKIAEAVATKAAVDAFGNPVIEVKALPGGIRVLVPEKDFAEVGPDGALRVSYDDIDLLKVINMEPVTKDAPQYFPDWLKDLEGKRVRIRGFMYPQYEETLEMFSLARDTQLCCFGRQPKVYDVFRVIMREGTTTDYIELKPFDVVGVFHIDPVELSGDLVQMYYIDDAVIVR